MMALANLLSHPAISDDRMTGPFGDRSIKRSSKDLGRSVALAWLDDENLDRWETEWLNAMKQQFPNTWVESSATVGDGLRLLLASPDDLEEAFHTWRVGLLSSRSDLSEAALSATGERLLQGPIAAMSVAAVGSSAQQE